METLESQAAIESGLAQEYKNDPQLLAFYKRKLLRRGWAGTYTPAEGKYVSLVHKAEGKYQTGAGERLKEWRQSHSLVVPDAPTDGNG